MLVSCSPHQALVNVALPTSSCWSELLIEAGCGDTLWPPLTCSPTLVSMFIEPQCGDMWLHQHAHQHHHVHRTRVSPHPASINMLMLVIMSHEVWCHHTLASINSSPTLVSCHRTTSTTPCFINVALPTSSCHSDHIHHTRLLSMWLYQHHHVTELLIKQGVVTNIWFYDIEPHSPHPASWTAHQHHHVIEPGCQPHPASMNSSPTSSCHRTSCWWPVPCCGQQLVLPTSSWFS